MHTLGVDFWEGSDTATDQIDWQLLRNNGVQFAILRMNNMNGGHHQDAQFTQHWEESRVLPIRWPFFVYNPWVKAEDNYAWLRDHMPEDATHVSIDVEVDYPGYAPSEYAHQVDVFEKLVSTHWSCDIYTGGWFLPRLSRWPNTRYWWARYPYVYYPQQSEQWSWEVLNSRLKQTSWNPGSNIPGSCLLWQLSGDRLKLPGTAHRATDINIFNGTLDELRVYIRATETPPLAETWQESVYDFLCQHGYSGPKIA